jgi:NtrC-family two-component system sensor histidine kinase KinB
MSLRTKLTVGLGFLFLIIFALTLFSSYQIQDLAREADTILKDNYASLVYCKNMLLALDDMSSSVDRRFSGSGATQASAYESQLFESGKAVFAKNLSAEKQNITELHESDYVNELESAFNRYMGLVAEITKNGGNAAKYPEEFPSAAASVRQAIIEINDVNMQAVERKSQSTHSVASRMIIAMAALGAFFVVLALFYFWYFSFYISRVMTYLAGKMKGLLQHVGLTIDTRTRDEVLFLSAAMDLLESNLARKTRQRK